MKLLVDAISIVGLRKEDTLELRRRERVNVITATPWLVDTLAVLMTHLNYYRRSSLEYFICSG